MDLLPVAILHEIFFRLPISAIVRCKIVCREWLKLLSYPDFIQNYNKIPSFTNLLVEEHCCEYVKLFLLEFSEAGSFIQKQIYPRGLPTCLDTRLSLFFIGSSNGLFCFGERRFRYHRRGYPLVVENLYVTNPITGECIVLPQHHRGIYNRFIEVFQFGFCPSTRNFKILRLFYSSSPTWRVGSEYLYDQVAIDIFTVGADDGWRCLEKLSIPDPSLPLSVKSDGPTRPRRLSVEFEWTTLHGIYHWLAGNKIHTFDLGEEKAGRILYPPATLLPENLRSVRLTVLNNQLAVVDNVIVDGCLSSFVIWTMKEYGVVESWTKDVILESWFPPNDFSELIVLGHQLPFPIAMSPNGAVLLSHEYRRGRCVFLCDPKKQQCIEFKISDHCSGPVITYDAPNFYSLKELLKGAKGSLMNAPSTSS